MNDIILTILECVVTITVIVVVRYIVPAIKSNISSTGYELLVEFVDSVVAAMQQTIEDNDEKKSIAILLVTEWVNDHGLDISESQIDVLIESAVRELNRLEGE